jgi:hypothetical protein
LPSTNRPGSVPRSTADHERRTHKGSREFAASNKRPSGRMSATQGPGKEQFPQRAQRASPGRGRQPRVTELSLRGHAVEAMNAKTKAVLARIEALEQAISRAKEYLENGKHADWSGFRPMFVRKTRLGVELPPHKDWVRNVFLRRAQEALSRAEKVLQQLASQERLRPRDNHRSQRSSQGRSVCLLRQWRGAAAAER